MTMFTTLMKLTAGRGGGLLASRTTTIRALAARGLSTQPATDIDKLIQSKWKSYLASGRGSESLFTTIAETNAGGGSANSASTISPENVQEFLKSVGWGVHPRAITKLESLASDHPMTLSEFQSWLVEATKFACGEHDATLQEQYKSHPNTGEQVDDADVIVEPRWNSSTMNQSVRKMQYAVRGSVVMLAEKLQSQGKEVLFTNIGNPQGVGQQPITYYRQVLALCDLPPESGVDHAAVAQMFPPDVVQKAREMQKSTGGAGTGAYTGSQGVLDYRQHVAEYIENRDGHKAYPGNIFLTNGASSAIDLVLTTLIADDHDAVMIPIPQYPIYSALIARLGGRQVGYYLHENEGWSIDLPELEKKFAGAHNDDDLHVKALVLINPGNPTGQVLSRQDLEKLCLFCAKHNIVLLADEVYQRNVYSDNKEFVSTKKVAVETPGCENLQLVSFHSTSKGLIGECGRRGGYMELHNIDSYVQSQLYKLASSGLCSNVPGQILTSLMVTPPQPGDASYDLFMEEEEGIYGGLARRAGALVDGLNSIDGISCQPAEGAMYAFPRINNLPDKALDEASKEDVTPDTLYALSLLDETGICVVPASGFGQEEGRFGFRTTFLPPEEKLMKAVDRFADHHKLFLDKYS